MKAPKTQVKELTIKESDEVAALYPYDGNVTLCLAVGKIGTWRYQCSRAEHHDGIHVAYAPKGPIATWPA